MLLKHSAAWVTKSPRVQKKKKEATSSEKMNEQHIWSHRTPHHQPSTAETDEWNHHRRVKINTVTIFYRETNAGMTLFVIISKNHILHKVIYPIRALVQTKVLLIWAGISMSFVAPRCVWQQITQIAFISKTVRGASRPMIYEVT